MPEDPININNEPPIQPDDTPPMGIRRPINDGDTGPLGPLPERTRSEVAPLEFHIEAAGKSKDGIPMQTTENGIFIARQDAGAIGRNPDTQKPTGAIVADGMGGYEGSEEASFRMAENAKRTMLEKPLDDNPYSVFIPTVTDATITWYAVDRSIHNPLNTELEDAQTALNTAQSVIDIEQAETRVINARKAIKEAPNTTATVVRYIQDNEGEHFLVVAHSGDSRASVIKKDGRLVQLTNDENMPWIIFAPDTHDLNRQANHAILDGELDSFVYREINRTNTPAIPGAPRMVHTHPGDFDSFQSQIFPPESYEIATFIEAAMGTVQSTQDLDSLDAKFQELFKGLPDGTRTYAQSMIEKTRVNKKDTTPARLHDFWNARNYSQGLHLPQITIYKIQEDDTGYLIESDATTDQETEEQRELEAKQQIGNAEFERTLPQAFIALADQAQQTRSFRMKPGNDDHMVICARIVRPPAAAATEASPEPPPPQQ